MFRKKVCTGTQVSPFYNLFTFFFKSLVLLIPVYVIYQMNSNSVYYQIICWNIGLIINVSLKSHAENNYREKKLIYDSPKKWIKHWVYLFYSYGFGVQWEYITICYSYFTTYSYRYLHRNVLFIVTTVHKSKYTHCLYHLLEANTETIHYFSG